MIRIILSTITIGLLITSLFVLYDTWHSKVEQNVLVVKKGEHNTKELRNAIDDVLQKIIIKTNNFVEQVNNKDYTKPELEALLIDQANSMDELLGATIAYDHFAYNEETKLYSPYFDKAHGKILRIEEIYDYTDESLSTSRWFVDPKKNGPQWVEPYFAQGAQAYVTDYSIPFYYQSGPKKGQFRGIFALTISLKSFTDQVHSLSLGKTGFGFVSSSKGAFLAHPNKEYIGSKNISEVIEQEQNPNMVAAYQSIQASKTGHLKFFDHGKKQNAYFFFDKVPASNWGIGVIFYQKDILGKETKDQFKKKYIQLALLFSLFFICFLMTLIMGHFTLESNVLWLSIASSLLMLMIICLVGHLQYKSTDNTDNINSPAVTDNTILSNFIADQNNKARSLNIETPIVIPTGVYIENMEFLNSHNLNISGQVWQKYPLSFEQDKAVPFRFPQTSPFAESSFIEESYRKKIKNSLLISYDFRITMRLNFSYNDYPLDKRNIRLEIQPLEHANGLFFVPDLKSYDYTSPSLKSGINPEINIPGNKILESYFSFQTKSYTTNFGLQNENTTINSPSLYFNIKIKRALVAIFIIYLMPIFVTLIMIFILVFFAGKSQGGIEGSGSVQGMAAFFFVLAFSHIDLRKVILTEELVYIENFYFISYIMIIAATYNIIAYSHQSLRLFNYKNNLIFKAMYWPLYLFALLIITLVKFYN